MFSVLSGFQSDISYNNCLFVVRSSWSSNPHFRGSYSFRSMETERMGVSAAQLSEPVANSNGISVCDIFTSYLFEDGSRISFWNISTHFLVYIM